MGYIYKITNTITNKSYVGVTQQINAIMRFQAHMSAIRNGRGCPLLAKAVKKYGEDKFIFEVLLLCADNDIFNYEKEYILKHNTMSPNGYNIAEGGKSGRNFLGKTHTEEVRKKIGKKSKEYNSRPEVKERARQRMIKLNERRTNGDLTDKWKNAINDNTIGNKGKKHGPVSEEVRKKISESLKKYNETNTDIVKILHKQKHSVILRNAKGRKIDQYSKENVFIAHYDSIIEATEKTTIKRSAIQACCSGRSKTSGGYIWKYTELEPKDD